jgi:hypothetical protein
LREYAALPLEHSELSSIQIKSYSFQAEKASKKWLQTQKFGDFSEADSIQGSPHIKKPALKSPGNCAGSKP